MIDAVVRVPGSKSLTNRALVCAALAEGQSTLEGALFADDTEAMLEGLRVLGLAVKEDRAGETITVDGCDGQLPAHEGEMPTIDARLSGTTARFLMPLLAQSPHPVRLDGAPGLRARPMSDGIAALRQLGAAVTEEGPPGHLPIVLALALGTDVPKARARTVAVRGEVSSQFLSGLLLSGPARPKGLRLDIEGRLVSRPYVEMTTAVMRAFGAKVAEERGGWTVAPGSYVGTRYSIEPDASAASYFFAAAAICGGRVTVEGLGTNSVQGDVGFVDVLAAMGCHVHRTDKAITVERDIDAELTGIDVDMSDISDTAQTLAAVAVFANSPTRLRGIGFIRGKETDRIGHVVRELDRCGIEAEEHDDGFTVHPGTPQPATIETYDDHRMAMSFALLGLRAEGIEIADPDCVAKTFPAFWRTLESLSETHG